MYLLYFGFLVSIFCSEAAVFANTIDNPPNAYLIDHRGIPQFDESENDNPSNHFEVGETINELFIRVRRRSESCAFF